MSVVRDGGAILSMVDWSVNPEDRWVVLGPNGAGKTTLLSVAATSLHPTSGVVEVLGERVGSTDLSGLRPHIGYVANAVARRVPRRESVLDVVLTAAYSVFGRWHEEYEEIDVRRARRVLAEWRLERFERREFGTLSDGEQKRVLIARAVMTDPEVLLLDEPAASLDLGSREELLGLLGGFASDPRSPAIVMVTHHVEEIPPAFTHVLLLAQGGVVAAGRIPATLTAANLEEAFGLPVSLVANSGRYSATARAR
ncbi:MAG TPA: ABC transporter ATP-binding protein [Microbacteriaceae bacterium]|nr:ABC transporter ATP-binding protein [Microbacteriaceae bacterium]